LCGIQVKPLPGRSARPTWHSERGFEVAYVEERSAAAKAGVLEGDRIVEINGLPCSKLMFESLHEMFTAEGAPFKLKVERDGKKIEINFQSRGFPTSSRSFPSGSRGFPS
jgi:S1-C subfamily serine protease